MQIWRTTWLVPGTSYMKATTVSQSLMFLFSQIAFPENSCFEIGLFCFILLCLWVAVFLNVMGRDRNFPPFTSEGKLWINAIHWDAEKEFMIATGTKVWLLCFMIEDLRRIASTLTKTLSERHTGYLIKNTVMWSIHEIIHIFELRL